MKHCTYVFFITLLLISGIVYRVQADDQIWQLGELEQGYLSRLEAVKGILESTTVVNPATVLNSAITESIDTVTKTVDIVNKQKEEAVAQIKQAVKEDIDTSIVEIRKTTSTPAYELQQAVDDERTQLFETVEKEIEQITPIEKEKVESVRARVSESIGRIKQNLEKESGVVLDFTKSERNVRDTLFQFQQVLIDNEATINSRQGDLVFADSDGDGLSDYDETYIYKTDPANARTVPGEKTDGQKVAEGIDPLSETEARIQYENPQEDNSSYVSATYNVAKVQLVKDDAGENARLVFQGSALPNSYITLFIFSTPIIVTVKTDNSGTWNYELSKELENGEHQIYVATVDNSGKIIARSNPILFTKTAEAATIGAAGTLDQSAGAQDFLRDNFILITLAVLIAIVILTMMFAGNRREFKAVVADLHNEINKK